MKSAESGNTMWVSITAVSKLPWIKESYHSCTNIIVIICSRQTLYSSDHISLKVIQQFKNGSLSMYKSINTRQVGITRKYWYRSHFKGYVDPDQSADSFKV